jgi:hypothetical protein
MRHWDRVVRLLEPVGGGLYQLSVLLAAEKAMGWVAVHSARESVAAIARRLLVVAVPPIGWGAQGDW